MPQHSTESTAKAPLSFLGAIGYSLANIGFGTFYSLNNAVLPLWLSRYTSNAVLINLMAGVHSFEGALLQPIAGSISDHGQWKFGRRRPFLILFIPVSAAFLVATPAASHLPIALRIAAIVLCTVLSTSAFNLALDPYQAMLGDITTPSQRGRITGLWMFFGAAGQVVLLVLPIQASLKFLACAFLMLATTTITCFVTKEPHLPADQLARKSVKALLTDGAVSLRTLKQARLFLVIFLCYGAGTAAVIPNLTLFIKRTTGCDDAHAQHLFMVLMLVTACATVPFGFLSDKVGAVRLLALGYVLVILASISGLWVHSLGQESIALSLAGLGIAAQNASSYPLLIRLIPNDEIGLFTGLQTAALSIVEPLTAIATGYLINHHGYRAIFPYCGFWVILAAIVLTQLKPESAPAEIAEHASR